jgi:hypothetical protein
MANPMITRLQWSRCYVTGVAGQSGRVSWRVASIVHAVNSSGHYCSARTEAAYEARLASLERSET